MGTPVGSLLARPALLRMLLEHARLAFRLLREPAVSPLVKTIPVLGGVYLISPIDVLPDFLPILGQLDDLGIALAALGLFLKLCPPAIVAFHREAMAAGRRFSPMHGHPGDIDAEFRRE